MRHEKSRIPRIVVCCEVMHTGIEPASILHHCARLLQAIEHTKVMLKFRAAKLRTDVPNREQMLSANYFQPVNWMCASVACNHDRASSVKYMAAQLTQVSGLM